MNDTTMSIIAIVLGAILMFIFPLIATADRSDDIAQQVVQSATADFVDDVRTTGKITNEKYNSFIENINGSTGHVYKVDMSVAVADENTRKKTQQTDAKKTGESENIEQKTSQIIEALETSSNNTYTLKQGDIFTVTVTNKDKTIAQILKGAFYKIAGNDTYAIAAKHTGIVNVNG